MWIKLKLQSAYQHHVLANLLYHSSVGFHSFRNCFYIVSLIFSYFNQHIWITADETHTRGRVFVKLDQEKASSLSETVCLHPQCRFTGNVLRTLISDLFRIDMRCLWNNKRSNKRHFVSLLEELSTVWLQNYNQMICRETAGGRIRDST